MYLTKWIEEPLVEWSRQLGPYPPDGVPFKITLTFLHCLAITMIFIRAIFCIVKYKMTKLVNDFFKSSPTQRNAPTSNTIASHQFQRMVLYHSSVLANIDERRADIKVATFDTDSRSGVTDNCANTHVGNDESMFVPGTLKSLSQQKEGVMTIGGSDHIPSAIGDVQIRLKDDQGQLFEHTLKDVLYFPNSPVNILSITCLARELNDKQGT